MTKKELQKIEAVRKAAEDLKKRMVEILSDVYCAELYVDGLFVGIETALADKAKEGVVMSRLKVARIQSQCGDGCSSCIFLCGMECWLPTADDYDIVYDEAEGLAHYRCYNPKIGKCYIFVGNDGKEDRNE